MCIRDSVKTAAKYNEDGTVKSAEVTDTRWVQTTSGNWHANVYKNKAARDANPHQTIDSCGGSFEMDLKDAAKNPVKQAYVAAKAGVMAFTKKVAKEVGPFGITCNAIAPNMTLSERVGPRWEQRSDEDKQRKLEAIPLRRISEPEDQAKVIAFLASSDADYVSGVTIDTNGGSY